MTTDSRRTLERELGDKIPDGLSTLTDEELSHFADLLRDTKQRQSQALESAIEDALGIVPRIVRGSVRKVLFG